MDEDVKEKSYDFEMLMALTEMWEDFLTGWALQDQLNQPTLLDFFEWIAETSEHMADELGSSIDEALPDTP